MIIFWLIFIVLFASFGLIVFLGAPFVPTKSSDIDEIFDELKIRKGALVVDMGSGDGRILLSAVKHGYRALGYELNPFLALFSRLRLRKQPDAKIVISDYWSGDVTKASVVFIFSATPFMARLYDKLKNELKPGAVVISYGFSFEGIKIDQKIGSANIYQF